MAKDKSAAELMKEREKRVEDAIALRVPEKVPMIPSFAYFPVSLLQTGSPDEIKAQAKKLIDIVGKDGGYIMNARGCLDEADPALVKVWVDYTREYGVYR